jgi:predicted enzyme related to lactoylglutathione lyase
MLFATLATVGAACASRSQSGAPPNTATPASRIGEFVWQDLMTDDVEKSRTFYEQLLGWQFEQTTRLGRPYLIAHLGSNRTPVAGIAQVARKQPDQPVTQWLSYLSVSDVDGTSQRLAGAGAQVLVPPTDVRSGRAAVAVDPQGAPVGLVELGADVRLPIGGPSADIGTFFWRDYLTKDVDGARTFYTGLAGLSATRQTRPDSLLHYVLTSAGSAPVGGVVPVGEREIRPHWLPYVRVNDPAAMAARAEQLGGRILLPVRADIRNGSVAVVADSGGAAIALQKWPF